MDPDEPIAPWFDDVFERLGDGRSAALRARLARTRVAVASMLAADADGIDLTSDLFIDGVPMLLLEANLPPGAAAARSHLSAISRLVDATGVEEPRVARARGEVRAARAWVERRAADAPPDARSQRIPRRLLQG